MTDKSISRFLDIDDKLKVWPSKQADKEIAIEYLSTKFDFNKTYLEHDINEILKTWHTFNDWPLLRRELFERGYFSRNRDGTDYRRLK